MDIRNGQTGENMRGVIYDAKFYKEEIERIQLYLTQSVGSQERQTLTNQLESAKQHLAEIEAK